VTLNKPNQFRYFRCFSSNTTCSMFSDLCCREGFYSGC